ncbi:MAG: trigger factor [Candidatus Cryptobacteroides sp.]|jgi:trigger factor
MNITKKQIDDLNIELTIALQGEDYAEQEKKRLSAYRRNADLKGFRKGMAPMTLISRLYGEQILYEVINALVSEQLDKFIKDNELNILGEPLPSASQPEQEWKSGNDFEFKFDLGLSPKLDFEVTKEDKVPYYKIQVTDAAKAEMKRNMLKQLGKLEEGEAAGEEDYVIADLVQDDRTVEGAYIAIRNVAGDARKEFLGAKAGDRFKVDVNAAFENENDRASLLKIKKEELAALEPEWNVAIVNVKTFVPAQENQETFDELFGKDVVKTPEEFDKKVAERLESNYKQESDYRLSRDLRAYLVDKAAISVPEDFLKRWLYENNREKFTKEQVEQEFNGFLADFRWQLVRGYLMKKFDLKIEDRDMQEAALGYAAYQYAMYGMGNVPEELLKEAAGQILSDERQARNLEENVENEKVIAAVREKLTLQNKKITLEKFQALK